MRHKLTSISLVALTLLFSAPTLATGQWGEREWRRYNKRQVAEIIKNVESSANDFRRDFNRWLDHSQYDGTVKEDRYNSKVRKFEQATNRLRAEFDRRDSWWETRNEVQGALNEARPVAQMMRNHEFGRNLESRWERLRRDINRLAGTYRLQFV